MAGSHLLVENKVLFRLKDKEEEVRATGLTNEIVKTAMLLRLQ